MQIRLASALVATLVFAAACGYAPGPKAAQPRQAPMGARAMAIVPEPSALPMLSPHFDDRKGAPISAIVLHHTAMAENAVGVGEFFQRPNAKVSSHYVVDRDGSLVRPVPDDKRAWHAGRSEFQGAGDVNTFSIGIEICNVGDGVEPYPEAQMQAVAKLVAWLAQTYQVPLTRLTRHRDVAIPAGRKRDTSDNFDHAWVAKAAQAMMDGRRPPAYRMKAAPAGYDAAKQTRVVAAGDTWASIADDVYDAEALGPAIAALNPGVALLPGAVIQLPTRYPKRR